MVYGINRKSQIICIFFCIYGTYISVTSGERVRRNAFQMCALIHQYTGRSCLQYNPYGCFCGYGQQGTRPRDDADRCCKLHDDCYGDLHTRGHCFLWSGVFIGYNYRCDERGCTCTDDGKCARNVCECDVALAHCLSKASFTPALKDFDRTQCD